MTIQTPGTGLTAQDAEALVLACIDYRLVGKVADYLKARGLAGRYDMVSLAGGALGVVLSDDAAWAKAFWDQLALARDLHGIQRLIAIDHRDCGACRAFVGETCAADPDKERETHVQAMTEFAEEARRRVPGLEVELLLMDLNGDVDRIA